MKWWKTTQNATAMTSTAKSTNILIENNTHRFYTVPKKTTWWFLHTYQKSLFLDSYVDINAIWTVLLGYSVVGIPYILIAFTNILNMCIVSIFQVCEYVSSHLLFHGADCFLQGLGQLFIIWRSEGRNDPFIKICVNTLCEQF